MLGRSSRAAPSCGYLATSLAAVASGSWSSSPFLVQHWHVGASCRVVGHRVVSEGFLDALGAGGADAVVDRKCLLQVPGGLAGVAFLEVAVADSFQGACFLGGCADVAGDGQRSGVLFAGLPGGRGAEREFAKTVQRFGLAEQVAEVTEQRQGLLVAGGGGRVVASLLLDDAQGVEGVGLAFQVAKVTE